MIEGSNSGVVFTLVDTATAELQQKVDLLSATTSQNKTPSLSSNKSIEKEDHTLAEKEPSLASVDITNTSILNRSEQVVNIQQTDKMDLDVPNLKPKKNATTATTTEKPEEIPSFSEWTQKQLEEAEKKKELLNNSDHNQNFIGKQNSSLKVRSKNYASPDCGAKIIAANPEATNVGALLSASKDEYNLNVCINRIWFIVELCEAVQAKKIDIANFELFSSSPKDFTVFISDRFPSREWSNVGQFIAKDVKDIQSFELNPHLFGKYVKVEVNSHYGSEHFCPISLFRVYGTSEFEVLEKEDLVHLNIEDDDDDETLDTEKGASPKNLFSSATDAVISIVKKAAEVLGNKGNMTVETASEIVPVNNISTTVLIGTCTTVSHYVVCDNCSDVLFGYVYELLSCKSKVLSNLVEIPFIKRTIYNSDICQTYGLHFLTNRFDVLNRSGAYLKALFANHYIAALCNTVAVFEEKVVLNASNNFMNSTKKMDLNAIENVNIESIETPLQTVDIKFAEDVKSEEIPIIELIQDKIEKPILPGGVTDISYTSQINPTKTLPSEDDFNYTKSVPSIDSSDGMKVVHPTEAVNNNKFHDTNGTEPKPNLEQEYVEQAEASNDNTSELEAPIEISETLEEHFESMISDLNGDSTTTISSPTASRTVALPGPKESVFLRLSNRIKALERNMSLSSQYLEELSRRYKKQVEEMQKLLDKTVTSWTEETKKHEETSQKLEEQIIRLTAIVETLVEEKNSWINTTYWLFLIIIAFVGIMTFCRRTSDSKSFVDNKSGNSEVQRRKSIDIVRHKSPVKKKRRPSEEALRITGTYQHLMVDDSGANKKTKDKKRRKKKQSLVKSHSITTLTEEAIEVNSQQRSRSDINARYVSSKCKKDWARQESAAANVSANWNDIARSCVEDIPFVLEESDNSGLETIPVKPELPTAVQCKENINGNIFFSNIRHFNSSFMRTARDSRLSRNSSLNSISNHTNKSRQENGCSANPVVPSRTESPATSEDLSLNSSIKEGNINPAKKEKKSGFKRIFRKVF